MSLKRYNNGIFTNIEKSMRYATFFQDVSSIKRNNNGDWVEVWPDSVFKSGYNLVKWPDVKIEFGERNRKFIYTKYRENVSGYDYPLIPIQFKFYQLSNFSATDDTRLYFDNLEIPSISKIEVHGFWTRNVYIKGNYACVGFDIRCWPSPSTHQDVQSAGNNVALGIDYLSLSPFYCDFRFSIMEVVQVTMARGGGSFNPNASIDQFGYITEVIITL